MQCLQGDRIKTDKHNLVCKTKDVFSNLLFNNTNNN